MDHQCAWVPVCVCEPVCVCGVGWVWGGRVVCSLESGAAHCLDLPALQEGFLSGVVLIYTLPFLFSFDRGEVILVIIFPV